MRRFGEGAGPEGEIGIWRLFSQIAVIVSALSLMSRHLLCKPVCHCVRVVLMVDFGAAAHLGAFTNSCEMLGNCLVRALSFTARL